MKGRLELSDDSFKISLFYNIKLVLPVKHSINNCLQTFIYNLLPRLDK